MLNNFQITVLAIRGGGRQSNQVGLTDREENISMIKNKNPMEQLLLKSGGAAAPQPHPFRQPYTVKCNEFNSFAMDHNYVQ